MYFMRLNDLSTSLEETLEIEDVNQNKEIFIEDMDNSKNTEDFSDSKKDITIAKNTEVKLDKISLKSSDSLKFKKSLKNKINISKKLGFLDKIKWKQFSFTGNKQFGKYDFSIKLGAILTCIALLLWIDKILVTAYVESGYKRLLKVKQESWNITMMQQNLNDARLDFLIADVLYYPFRIIPSRDIWNGNHVIKWWKNLTQLGDNMFAIYSSISKLIEEKWIKNISTINLVKNLQNELIKTQLQLTEAITHYDSVKNLSDWYIAYQLTQANNKLKTIAKFNNSLNNNYDGLLKFLWEQEQRKYLVVFQNADEIRPTGWFMWSMWIVTIENGKVLGFDKRDVYNYEWNLKTEDYERIKAPKWINQLTEYLGLRDANYLINLKDSSNNIKFFMNRAGFEIDGIIYLNQNMIIDLLEKTGWVQLDYLDREITHHNFSSFISTIVEAKLTKQWTLWTPKQVLFDFIEQYQKNIQNNKQYSDVANVFIDNLIRREVWIYSFHSDENTLLSELWLNYNIDYNSTLDFAYPVYTSLSGNKSDRYMKREYSKTVDIRDDCSIHTNLEITLKHLMTKNKQQELQSVMDSYDIANQAYNLQIQWAADNHSFIRVLLPKDSNIQDNNLISIIRHPSSTEVNFFIKTRLLETRWFNLYYSLENPNCKPYDFTLYKQPGIREYNINISDDINNTQKSWVNKDFYYSIKE